MTHWRRLAAGCVLMLALLAGWGCAPAETALPPSSGETADSLPSGPSIGAGAPALGSSSLGSDGLGAFPTFMPPVALGTDTQECQLGTDPYSTCI